MKKRWKRLIAAFLAVVMLVTVLPTQALASVSATWTNSAAENEAILAQLEAITGSQEEAQALYARLDALGVLGEDGWVTEELVIGGESYTLDEAVAFVNTLDDSEIVQVGDVSITAGDLKTMLAIEQEIARIRQTYFYDEDWTDEQLAMLEDFQNALNSGNFTVSSQLDGTQVGPSGVDHGARITITPSGDGTSFTAALTGGTANQEVTFRWAALSGSQTAGGEGTVTLTQAEPTETFTVSLDSMTENTVRSTSSLVWYLKLDGAENALFSNGRSAMTMKLTESPTVQTMPGVFSLSGTVTCELKYPEGAGFPSWVIYPAQISLTETQKKAFAWGIVSGATVSQTTYPEAELAEGSSTMQWPDGTDSEYVRKRRVSFEAKTPDGTRFAWAEYGYRVEGYFSDTANKTTNDLPQMNDIVVLNGQNISYSYRQDTGATTDSIGEAESLGVKVDFFDKKAPGIVSVTAPEGTYYSGQTVPVTVTFSEPVKSASAQINGVSVAGVLDSGKASNVVVFPYPVADVDNEQVSVGSISASDLAGNQLTGEAQVSAVNGVSLSTMQPEQAVDTLTADLADAIPAAGGQVTFTAALRKGYKDVFLSQGYKLYLSTDGGQTVHQMTTTDEAPEVYTGTISFLANETEESKTHAVELYLGVPGVGEEGETVKLYFGCLFSLSQAAARYITEGDLSILETNFPEEGVTIYPDSVKDTPLQVAMQLNGTDFTFVDPEADFLWSVEVQKSAEGGEPAWETDATGAVASVTETGTISLGGTPGTFRVVLTAFNGGQDTEEGTVGGADVTVYSHTVTVGIGANPILMIAPSLQRISIRSGDDAVVRWTSNLTQKQYEVLKEQGKTEEEALNTPFYFTVQAYRHQGLNYSFSEGTEPDFGDGSWEAVGEPIQVASTQSSTISQCAVSGLAEPSAAGCYGYGIRVTAAFTDALGQKHSFDEFALVSVTSKPAVVTLEKPQLYYLEGSQASLRWTVENFDTINDAEFSLVITNSDTGKVVYTGTDELLTQAGTGTYTGSYTLSFDPLTDYRDTYTVELRARNSAGSTWSYDSAVLYCYDTDAFQIYVDGQPADSLTMDNVQRLGLEGYTDSSELRDAVLALKRDIPLINAVQLNPNVGWGSVSDQVVWDVEGSAATLNYRQGTLYEDFRLFDYESFDPGSNFLLSGLQSGDVTVSAAHKLAQDVLKDQLDVRVETLRDKLYLFQVYPAASQDGVTVLEYTNGAGEVKQVYADETGAAVIYDPAGIKSDVRISSQVDGKTYLGTLYQSSLVSGEGDATKLALYPLNTVKLREAATLELYVKDENGAPLKNKQLTINGGVYKNGVYCPDACFTAQAGAPASTPGSGEGFAATTDGSGKLTIYMDVNQFYTKDEAQGTELEPSDGLTFRLIVQSGTAYFPQLVERDGTMSQSETVRFGENVVALRKNTNQDSKQAPYVLRQQAQLGTESSADLMGFTGKVGPGPIYSEVTLITDVVWWGVDNGKKVLFYDGNGTEAPGQTAESVTYEFTDLKLTRVKLVLNEKSVEGWIPALSTRTLDLKYFAQDDSLLQTQPQSFRVANMLDAAAPNEDPDAKASMEALLKSLTQQLLVTSPTSGDYAGVVGDGLLGAGLTLVAGTGLNVGDFLNLNIFATKDPTVFRGLFSVGFGDVTEPGVLQEGGDIGYFSMLQNLTSSQTRAETMSELKKAVNMLSTGGKKHGLETSKELGGFIESEIYYEDGQWHIHVLNGGLRAGFGAEYTWRYNSFVGYIPVTAEFTAGAAAAVELKVGVDRLNDLNYYLTELRIAAYLRAFGGFGFDYSIIALKIGIFGTVDFGMTARWFNEQGDTTIYGNQNAQQLTLNGRTGIEFYVAFLFFSYRTALFSVPLVDATWQFSEEEWNSIEADWEKVGKGISAVDGSIVGMSAANALYYDSRSGQTLYASPTVVAMEDREYLARYDRVWNPGSGFMSLFSAGDGSDMTTVLENAYPNSAPILTEDGQMMVFLDDNPKNLTENVPVTDTRAAFALRSGDSFVAPAAIDGGENTGYGDSQLAAAGTKDFAAAAWVRLNADPGKEPGAEMSSNDQMAMIASTEIMAAVYNGSEWLTTALTDNGNAPDLAPAVAAADGKAIVAWRSVSASNGDNPTRFDAGDSILYRTYDGSGWSETKTLYNGTSGAVKGLEAAMLEDGTAALVYTIDTKDRPLAGTVAQAQVLSGQAAEDNTGLEIVYALVDDLTPAGQTRADSGETASAANVRLTYDDQLDENPQVTVAEIGGVEHFILGWSRTNPETGAHDLALRAVDGAGNLRSDLPDSVALMTSGDGVKITSKFRFSKGAGDIGDLAILWVEPVTSETESADSTKLDAERDQLMAVKLVTYTDDSGRTTGYGLTAPLLVKEMADYTLIDHFDAVTAEGGLQTILLTSDYGTGDYKSVLGPNGQPLQARNDDGQLEDVLVAVSMSNICALTTSYENEVSIDKLVYDQGSVMPGFSLPVQMTVTNRGVDSITGLTVTIGDREVQTADDLSLAPGQSLPLTVYYQLPGAGADISDVTCQVEARFGGERKTDTETLALGTPDVGISRLELVDQVDGNRVLQATLYNDSEVPLDSSRHTVKLALYSDSACTEENRLAEPVTLSGGDLPMVNEGGYTTRLTFDLEAYVKDTLKEEEVPAGGLMVYAKAWIEEQADASLLDLFRTPEEPAVVEDTRTANDIMSIAVMGLLEQRDNAPVTLTSSLDNSGEGSVVSVTVQNNSLSQKTTGNLIVTLLDADGSVLEQLQSYTGQGGDNGFITLGAEGRAERTFTFTQKGVSVAVSYSDMLLEADSAELASLSFSNIPGVTLADFVEGEDGVWRFAVSTDDLTSTAVMASAESTKAAISLADGAPTGNALSQTVPLIPGETTEITITVTCGDQTRTYILTVQNNGDPIIETPDGSPNPGQYSASTFYAADEAVISLTATENGDYSLSYQWYACDVSGENRQLLEGETASTLTIPSTTDTGVYYYRCKVTRHLLSGGVKDFWSSVASVEIKPAEGNSVTLTGADVTFDGQPHGLAGAAAAKEGSVLWYSTDGGSTWSEDAPAFTAVGVHTVWAYAANPNYVDSAVVTADVVIRERAGTLFKLDTQPVSEAFAGYPESIRTEYGDAAGLESALREEMAKLGVRAENMAVYDVKLLFSLDNGVTWTEATAENFPAAGVTVKLPYPQGTGRYSHTFTLRHLITDPLETGKTVGELETMDITLEEDGVRFTADCLSPFILGWELRPSSAPAKYTVAAQDCVNGSFTVKSSSAAAGETVTITTRPDEGYEVETVTVTTRNGRNIPVKRTAENTYTFEMPYGAVIAQVKFTPVDRWENPFTDVAADAWYYDAVRYANENGLMSGVAANRFAPELTTTRAMMITLLYRMEGSPAMDETSWGYPYRDVEPDAWYTAPVYWARMSGIMNGYSDEAFGPEDPLTREQMATILYRYAQYKGIDTSAVGDLSPYSDALQVSSWAKEAVGWANAEGIINGTSDTTLSPGGSATRVQAAQVLMNYRERFW